MDQRNTPAPINAQLVRAVLISHFPERFTKESLIPRMKDFGVDIVRTVNIERTPEFKPGDVDLIICMKDFMSHASFDASRAVARRHSRTFIALTRKAADWEEKLEKALQRTRQPASPVSRPRPMLVQQALDNEPVLVDAAPDVPAPPPSEQPAEEDLEEVSSEQFRELLGMFETENVRLEGENKALIQRLVDSDKLAGALEKQLETEKKTVRAEREQWDRTNQLVITQQGTIDALRVESERLIRELRGELTDALRARDQQKKEAEVVRASLGEEVARLLELQQAAQSKPGIDKDALLAWDRLLRGVRSGNAPDFAALLEFSTKADISTGELLALLKG